MAKELAKLDSVEIADVARALKKVRSAPSATPAQQDGAAAGAAPPPAQQAGPAPCPCASCGRMLKLMLRCPDRVCELATVAAEVSASKAARLPRPYAIEE